MASSKKVKTGTIRVEGLSQLNKQLKALGPEMQRELVESSRNVARFVTEDARSAAGSLGGVAAHVAPSLSAVGGARSAGVAFGGARFPMAGGAEFGSVRFKQFKMWRGNGSDAGYFVYPTIRRDADRIETEYNQSIEALLKKAFPD